MTQTSTQQSRKSLGIFMLLLSFFAVMAFAASAQKSYNVSVISPTSGMIMVKGQKYTLQLKITNAGMSAIPMGDTVMVDISVNGMSAYMGGTILMTPIAMGGSQTFNIPDFSYSGFTANNDNSSICMTVSIPHNTNSGTSKSCQTVKLRLSAPTAVATAVQEAALSFYPNPAGSFLKIKSAAGTKGSFKLFDISGRQVASLAIVGGEQQLATDSYSSGMYFYNVQSDNGTLLQSGKLSIAH